MKIKFNKLTKSYEVISKTIFGESNLLASFKNKDEAKDYVYSMTGDISVLA